MAQTNMLTMYGSVQAKPLRAKRPAQCPCSGVQVPLWLLSFLGTISFVSLFICFLVGSVWIIGHHI